MVEDLRRHKSAKWFVYKDLRSRFSDNLEKNGGTYDEIVKPWLKQAYEIDNKNWLQQTKLARLHLAF